MTSIFAALCRRSLQVMLWPTMALLIGLVLSDWAQADEPFRERINHHIKTHWDAQKVSVAPLASDAEFLRRVYLDLLGVIPSYKEAAAFLNDSSENRRAELVDRLLEHPRYAVHQADVWDMVFFGRNPPGNNARTRAGFQRWLRKQFNDNRRYDQLAQTMLKANGNTIDDGAPMYLIQFERRPEDAAVAVTKTFLGVQLECARCHDHPFESYTQIDFYGMAAFFARLEMVDVGKQGPNKKYAIGEKNLGDVLFTGPASEQTPGKKGEPIAPKFMNAARVDEPELPEGFTEPRRFDSGKMPPPPKFSRKDALADWITSPDNPYFARAAVNRIWGQFMGRGIVHPVDNLSDNNPASHPELLDEMATAFVEHQFDVKWLIREIVNAQPYQLASHGESTLEMPLAFQRARFRPLSAEELFESWKVANGQDETLWDPPEPTNPPDRKKGRFTGPGITWDYFRRYFGNPSDGAGNFQGGMGEHLFMNNGQVHQLITKQEGGLHHELSNSASPWTQRVDRLFLQVLSRHPTEAETETFVQHLSANDNASDRIHEAIWALMTSSEFRFNH